MLIGAHVSPAGGPANAVERGVERGCRAIQIFNQSPRQWKPTVYDDEKVAAFKEAFAGSDVDALLIHAVYLVNCASEDKEMREKSLTSLTASLRAGAALGAVGVVLHPGSALKDEHVDAALERAAEVDQGGAGRVRGLRAAPREHRGRGRHAGPHVRGARDADRGRGRRQAAAARAWTRATCWPAATTSAPPRGSSDVVDEFDRVVGLDRLGSLHVNDSKTALGSNVDRHANLGEGELGEEGCAAFLSEPRFEGLAVRLRGPGRGGQGGRAGRHRQRLEAARAGPESAWLRIAAVPAGRGRECCAVGRCRSSHAMTPTRRAGRELVATTGALLAELDGEVVGP